MIVHKFGGTSLAGPDRMHNAARLVVNGGPPAVVVVSAMAGVTNVLSRLVQLHRAGDIERIRQALTELQASHVAVAREVAADADTAVTLETRIAEHIARLDGVLTASLGATGADDPIFQVRLKDEATSAGEDLSAELMAAAITRAGSPARVVDARSLIRTDGRFGNANPLEEVTNQRIREVLLPLLAAGETPVVQGFLGATVNGVTTTLGRGGSDFTAAILAAGAGADEVNIWTDVDGMRSSDPNTVEDARHIEEIGFEEAVELAYFGARVVYARAAQWAVSRGVTLRIRNSFNPDGRETRLLSERRGSREVAAVAYKPDVILIKVRAHPSALPYGFLARVFKILSRHHLAVDLVATSHSSTAFTIDQDEEVAEVGLELGEFADVEVIQGMATVTVVGHGLMEEPGFSARVFEAVGHTPVHLISQASDVSLSFVVNEDVAQNVVRAIHRRLIAPRPTGVRR